MRWQLVHISRVEAVGHKIFHIPSPDALHRRAQKPAREKSIQWDALVQAQKSPLNLSNPGWLIAKVHQLVDDAVPAVQQAAGKEAV